MPPTLPDYVSARPLDKPGATGSFQLPGRGFQSPVRAAPGSGGSTSGSRKQQDRLRVLVVEDNLDTAAVLDHNLQAWGYASRVCTSGNEALALAPYYHPHVVLIDIGLPDIDGWELARRLRQQHDDGQPVFIAVTAHGEEDDFHRSQAAGIGYHLVKPAFQPQLREILERLARGK